mmetsp:Transcript_28494/g.49428  ORF Transcript_28494/g.49428 Transcript_28494/m.49428 type:complete len:87 (-) Transcript_28494:126-386(-)
MAFFPNNSQINRDKKEWRFFFLLPLLFGKKKCALYSVLASYTTTDCWHVMATKNALFLRMLLSQFQVTTTINACNLLKSSFLYQIC